MHIVLSRIGKHGALQLSAVVVCYPSGSREWAGVTPEVYINCVAESDAVDLIATRLESAATRKLRRDLLDVRLTSLQPLRFAWCSIRTKAPGLGLQMPMSRLRPPF